MKLEQKVKFAFAVIVLSIIIGILCPLFLSGCGTPVENSTKTFVVRVTDKDVCQSGRVYHFIYGINIETNNPCMFAIAGNLNEQGEIYATVDRGKTYKFVIQMYKYQVYPEIISAELQTDEKGK